MRITKNEDCTGCSACYSICPQNCIAMIPNSAGFLYPVINIDKCTSCGKCRKVCSDRKKIGKTNILYAMGCYNKNDTIRLKSSSGGIFYLLARKVLMDHGVVFGARFSHNYEVVRHDYIENPDDVYLFQGSKYVQSEIGESYKLVKEFLLQGRKVLFSGTPCQNGGLISFLRGKDKNLVCVDFICHGVPSPKLWQKYLEFTKRGRTINSVNFRDKEKGWKNYSLSFFYNDGASSMNTCVEDKFLKLFLEDTCLRDSCYHCAFKTLDKQSDITLADFWGAGNILKNFDDDKGISLVLINSNKGKNLIQQVENNLICQPVSTENSLKLNPTSLVSSFKHPNRNKLQRNIELCNFDELFNIMMKRKFFFRFYYLFYRIYSKLSVYTKLSFKQAIRFRNN
jgi:coenzyme F420-reducing hydrogenase beta subunit